MKNQIIISIVFIVGYIAAAALGLNGWQAAAGILLCTGACVLSVIFYLESKWILDYRVILSLFWLGGEGIAALQLSNLQSPWQVRTWAAFGLFYLAFLWGDALGKFSSFRKKKHSDISPAGRAAEDRRDITERIYHCIWIVAAVSVLCFWTEVVILGYIPLFSKDTHAYNYFHVTGIHYITFSCMLVHPLTLMYLLEGGNRKGKRVFWLIFWNVLALSIPIFCISKFQFILTILLPIMIYFLYRRTIPWKTLLIGTAVVVCAAVGIFVFMTWQRNYEAGYLNQIFDMKNQQMPLALQYVYMYIANNYDNFNCLVEALQTGQAVFLHGLKELFPVFALTGMKFVFPGLVSYPTFSTVTELNTLTILYDAYYDFGLAGCMLFGGVLGLVCRLLTRLVSRADNPVSYLFYGEVAMYLLLSFFSTWFTNPTTWFWFAVTGILYLYIGGNWKKGKISSVK